MALDAELDLLASDTELSGRGNVDTQFSSHLGFNPSACTQDQAFHQFVQLLGSKLDQKLATFKRSLEEKEEFQASQLKKVQPSSETETTPSFQSQRFQPFRLFFRARRQPQPATDKCFSCRQHDHWTGSPVCGNRYRTDSRGSAATTSTTRC